MTAWLISGTWKNSTLYFTLDINNGYTIKPRGLWDLDARRNLYKHPHAKRKDVYDKFPRGSKSRSPEGSSYKVFIL